MVNQFQGLFDTQKNYFDTDATKSYEWRIDQLDRMASMLREHEQAFVAAVGQDFKTASQEKIFEVSAPLGTIEFTKSQLKQWMEPVAAPLPRSLVASGHTASIIREPYGVTLVIGPFNGPLILLLHPAIAALSAGNTCILKPSENAPATAELLMKLVPQYFDPQAVVAVSGSREEVKELLRLPFDFIFFTGSSKVGQVVMKAAAEHFTPVVLELGGQNPAIVDETANISDAAKKIVWGATAWGGQWCTSPGYAYVHESVAERFVQECVRAVIDLYGSDPRTNADYSKIIHAGAVKRLAALIDSRQVVHGGKSDPEARYLDPTILFPVEWTDPIMADEIFGPILPILTYRQLPEAYAEIKKRPKPLSAFLFSRNSNTVNEFLRTLSFGGGVINQANIHLYIESMPFGGVGSSGVGHYYGKYGFDTLTHAKSILRSPPDVAIEHLFPPYTDSKNQALTEWFDY